MCVGCTLGARRVHALGLRLGARGEQRGGVALVEHADVAHGRLEVGVPEPALHVLWRDAGVSPGVGGERVPEVLEAAAQRAEARGRLGGGEALGQVVGVQELAGHSGEHQVVGAGEVVAQAAPGEDLGGVGLERDGADLVVLGRVEVAVDVVAPDVDLLAVEVDVAPADGHNLAAAVPPRRARRSGRPRRG
jgi:hypothetical protein